MSTSLAGKAKAGTVHSIHGQMCGWPIKLCDLLKMCAIPEHFCGKVPTRRGTISSVLYLYLMHEIQALENSNTSAEIQAICTIKSCPLHTEMGRYLSNCILYDKLHVLQLFCNISTHRMGTHNKLPITRTGDMKDRDFIICTLQEYELATLATVYTVLRIILLKVASVTCIKVDMVTIK